MFFDSIQLLEAAGGSLAGANDGIKGRSILVEEAYPTPQTPIDHHI